MDGPRLSFGLVGRRRFLLTALVGALVTSLVASAQPPGQIPKIGWLTSSTIHAPNVNAFREGMRSLGYPEIRLEARAAAGRADVLAALAADLLTLNVDVIVTEGRPGANVTGFTISTGAELYGKRLELLREAIPGLSRVVVVWNPRNEGARTSLPAIESAARAPGGEAPPTGA